MKTNMSMIVYHSTIIAYCQISVKTQRDGSVWEVWI